MTPPAQGAREPVDVALLLEGTYPYVRGGVSAWTAQIVAALPETSFSIVFLGSRREDYGERAYQPPPNVRGITCHYLFDRPERAPPRAWANGGARIGARAQGHTAPGAGGAAAPPSLLDALLPAGAPPRTGAADFLRADALWERICEAFELECPGGSFIDFFWTIRAMHTPLLGLVDLAMRMPAARCYHALCTGYAGFLGALLARTHARPFVLTEHGIYTKERKIDLSSAAHLPGDGPGGGGFARRLWIRFFEGLGRTAYAAASPIISLYEGNRLRQIQDGAAPARTRVISNGVDVERFRPLRAARPSPPPPVIGLLGRVVSIKDIKTFIHTVKAVVTQLPRGEGWVIGPTEEDPAYYQECVQLAAALGLGARLKFVGFAAPEAVLPRLGVLALTSISEALPLVVLEAFASGLPVVTTDVGSCRELVEGRTPEDRALGTAGAVVPIADPGATARALVELLRDPVRWRAAQRAGIRRVEAYYARDRMVDAYREVYEEAHAIEGRENRAETVAWRA